MYMMADRTQQPQATVVMSIVCFFSFMWFRRKTYELFLLVHIVLSAVMILGLF